MAETADAAGKGAHSRQSLLSLCCCCISACVSAATVSENSASLSSHPQDTEFSHMDFRLFFLLLIVSLTLPSTRAGDEGIADDNNDAETVTQEPDHVIKYSTPNLQDLPHKFYEHFDDELLFNQRWVKSQATKSESEDFQYDGEWGLVPSHDRVPGDSSLILKSRAKHHAISSKLSKSWRPDKGLVLQYDVQFRNGQECGGAYLKLLSSPSGPLTQVNDKTQYSIMFGPDKCGNDYKLHFIFMHKHPKNGSLREIHWNKVSSVSKLEEAIKDGKWHQLRLHIKPDNSFEIQLDKRIVGSGSLLEDFTPAVNPPQQIDDPHDHKPEDWDEREKIPDPDARKPDDWDESEPRKIADPSATKPSDWLDSEPDMIPDPDAEKPSDWDPDMDGEWQAPSITNPKCASVSGCGEWKAPLVDNPKFKGKWKPNLIPNPNYRGKWAPRKIPNPDFFEDLEPHKVLPIDAVAFELWTISDSIAFDNVLLTTDAVVADHVLEQTFQIKKDLADEESDGIFVRLVKYTNKKPYLWAVYVLVIAIPVIFFIAYCCVEPASKKQKDEEIRRKKTDDPSPDFDGPSTSSSGSRIQEIHEEEDEELDEPPVSSQRSSKRNSPAKPAASPASDEGEEDEAEEEEEEVAEEEEENVIEEDGEEVEEETGDTASEVAQSAGSHASPRQRKTRSRKE